MRNKITSSGHNSWLRCGRKQRPAAPRIVTNIVITDPMSKVIGVLVQLGAFPNASAVGEEALRVGKSEIRALPDSRVKMKATKAKRYWLYHISIPSRSNKAAMMPSNRIKDQRPFLVPELSRKSCKALAKRMKWFRKGSADPSMSAGAEALMAIGMRAIAKQHGLGRQMEVF